MQTIPERDGCGRLEKRLPATSWPSATGAAALRTGSFQVLPHPGAPPTIGPRPGLSRHAGTEAGLRHDAVPGPDGTR